MSDAAAYRIRLTLAVGALTILSACGSDRRATPMAPSSPLTPLAPSPPARSYLLTFRADPACAALPEVARARTYAATFGTTGPSSITLEGAAFGGGPSYVWRTIYAVFTDDAVRMYFHDPPIWEQLTAREHLVLYGIEAAGQLRDLPATLSFAGDFSFCGATERDNYPECHVPDITCRSSAHTLTIAPR